MMKLLRVECIIRCLILTLTKATRLTMGEKLESIHKHRESACRCRRPKRRRSDPWLGKTPERRQRQPTPALLPGESMDRGACWAAVQRGRRGSDTTEWPSRDACTNPFPAVLLSQALKNYFKFWVFMAETEAGDWEEAVGSGWKDPAQHSEEPVS